MTLKTLYKQTKTGAIQQYDIEVKDNTYIVYQGQVGGKVQEYVTICEPKNIGKANESSAEEQAETEAIAKHTKQIKKGYSLNPSGEITKKLPQKVKKFQDVLKTEKTRKNLIFPCYSEDKLNGVNGEYRLEDGNLSLWSRGGEEYPVPQHHLEPVTRVLNHFDLDSINVELYIHDEFLQDIQSAVTKHNKDTYRLIACIFEFPTVTSNYESKIDLKHSINSYIYKENLLEALAVIIPIKVNSLQDIEIKFNDALKRGMEGTIITNMRSVYTYNQKSSNVWKYKKALDKEFKVINYKLDKYKHVVFTCEVPNGTFEVKLKGTAEARLAMALDVESYIGKWLKVEFETYSKDGIPLKPVGIHFRKCDANGNPLE